MYSAAKPRDWSLSRSRQDCSMARSCSFFWRASSVAVKPCWRTRSASVSRASRPRSKPLFSTPAASWIISLVRTE